MASLLAMGNGVYNRDGVVIDYNGRQGHHPKGCNCVKGHINKAATQINPLQISPIGVTPVSNDQTLTFEQWQQQQAYEAYIAANNGGNQTPPNVVPAAPNPVPNPVVQTPPVVTNPVVPTFVAGQNEYVIPINVTLPKKGMAQVTDARMHVEPKFTDGIHDFRFAKGYASRAIVSNGEWELVLRRKA